MEGYLIIIIMINIIFIWFVLIKISTNITETNKEIEKLDENIKVQKERINKFYE